jgi:Pyrimidine dimer DNA glycosylase
VRLWTLHPKHLDAKGLVALWREALLAQSVLRGRTKGYKHHPQLIRFQAVADPAAAIAAYLIAVRDEAVRRGYAFDATKIGRKLRRGRIVATKGQLLYEWKHLKRKLRVRDPARHKLSRAVTDPDPHPMFRITDGPVEPWERLK